jgi:hypothetical protein
VVHDALRVRPRDEQRAGVASLDMAKVEAERVVAATLS